MDSPIPIVKADGNKVEINIDSSLFSKEAITATLYKFSHVFYINESLNVSTGNDITVILESKDCDDISETTIKNFWNELVDQQLRQDVNKRCGHIRDLIVEEAFKPITR